jgi:hypothetical protein
MVGGGGGSQIWENYKLKSARALSAGFLLLWTLGDSTNLIGCAILIGYGDVVATQVGPSRGGGERIGRGPLRGPPWRGG